MKSTAVPLPKDIPPDRQAGMHDVLVSKNTVVDVADGNTVPDILSAIRTHLKMEVAFVSEFIDGRRVFRYVDSSWEGNPVKVGNGDPLEESYCQRIVDGRLPELIIDARENAVAAKIPATFAVPVGAHLSIPITLSDGSIYGTFCCFNRSADPTLTERDLGVMRVFAELASKMIDRERQIKTTERINRNRIKNAFKDDAISMVFQPIFDLNGNKIVGVESLARFAGPDARTPDLWFNEAHAIGLGVELEMRAIELALKALPDIQQSVYLSINASPATILFGALDSLFSEVSDLSRIVLEITEHEAVHQYKDILAVLLPFRQRGLQIAIDDAGAGYASFRHIINLSPDRIKLDISLTRDIDTDPAKRALTAAFVHFSQDTGSKLIAEGVETAAELAALQALGVSKVQGYFLGRPMQLQEILARWATNSVACPMPHSPISS